MDSERDCFVHSLMLQCAKDAQKRLWESGVMDRVLSPGEDAYEWPIICVGHSLGAGIACILAILLRTDAERRIPQEVRYVGFEPPGGLLSKRLAKETQRLGFVSAVCAHDWISRLSISSVQKMYQQILLELHHCERTKLQLALLNLSGMIRSAWPCFCCLAHPFGALLEWIAGGPLELEELTDFSKRTEEDSSEDEELGLCHKYELHAAYTSISEKLYPNLIPAGHIVYFRPTDPDWKCLGCYQSDESWVAEWIQAEDLWEIVVSMRSVELHFPNIITFAYGRAAHALGVGNKLAMSLTSEEDDG